MNDIYDDLKAKEDLVGIESIFYEIYEDSIAQDSQELQKDDLTARFKRVSKVSLMRQEDLLESRISFLSTVASASPYIGLFGTVWGIMNSFRGLAQTSQATLSVVARNIRSLNCHSTRFVCCYSSFNRLQLFCEKNQYYLKSIREFH